MKPQILFSHSPYIEPDLCLLKITNKYTRTGNHEEAGVMPRASDDKMKDANTDK